MTVTTVTSRQFDRDTGGAKKAARRGPVFITYRGQPAYVLLTIEEYHRLSGDGISLAAALAQPGENDFEFNPSLIGGVSRPADLG
jgi:prevent-host-death family protein